MLRSILFCRPSIGPHFTRFFLSFLVSQIKDDKQKPSSNTSSANVGPANKKKIINKTTTYDTGSAANNTRSGFSSSSNYVSTASAVPPPPMVTLTNGMHPQNCNIVGSGLNCITERMEKMKLGPQPVPIDPMMRKFTSAPPPAVQSELTTPTAIQINQAVSQLSSRPTFPNNFDLENIKLPPGITITKVDPTTVQRKPIQVNMKDPRGKVRRLLNSESNREPIYFICR